MGTFPNDETKFKKGKSGNPNGRPRRFVSSVIKELEDKGIERVSPSQVISLYEKLLNASIKELTELANDEEASWEVRQTAKYMLKNPEKAWADVHDRAHGKAKQYTDLTTGGDKLTNGLSDDDRRLLEEALRESTT